jgi:hypothetical protein
LEIKAGKAHLISTQANPRLAREMLYRIPSTTNPYQQIWNRLVWQWRARTSQVRRRRRATQDVRALGSYLKRDIGLYD